MKTIYYFFAFVIILIFTTAKISFSSYISGDYDLKIKFFTPVLKKLLKKGADSAFVFSLITDPNIKFNEKFVKINVTGYLKKTDYSKNYNWRSVRACKKFLRDNYEILNKADSIYKISKEVITAIIWVETKLGNITGDYNIASVFLSTAMADQQQFYNVNRNEIRSQFANDTNEVQKFEKKLHERTNKKVNWAIEEILALNKIYKKTTINIKNIDGSWAGAFGIPQFLPTSYLKYAQDGNNDGIIDLFNLEDAIYSIANYMKKAGWTDKLEDKRKAVFQYNNSDAYVDAILILTAKIKESWKIPIDKQVEDTDL